MNGHEPLQAMRRIHRIPRCVWITDGDDIRSRDWDEEPNVIDQQRHAVISLAAADIPEAIDFRCVVGLEVHLSAERGETRARRLHTALIEAGAKRVITSIHAETGIDLLTHGV
jgi:non-ribosomal peptide synthetase component F